MKIRNYEPKNKTVPLSELEYGDCYKLVEDGVIYMKSRDTRCENVVGIHIANGIVYEVDEEKQVYPVKVECAVIK